MLLTRRAIPLLPALMAAERALRRRGRGGRCLLDRQTDLSLGVDPDDLHLYHLVQGKMIGNFLDIRRSDLGNMYHPRLVSRQLHKSSKLRDTSHFTL